jgi:hypothetical protein
MSDNQREVEELEAETHRQRIRTESQTRAIEARGLSIQKAHEYVGMIDIKLFPNILCEFESTDQTKLP